MEKLAISRKEKRFASTSSEESYAGPVLSSSIISLPITPSPLRPLPKRLRRTRGSSEDGPPQDEDDEIRNEEYRTGGPQLCNLPAISESVPSNSPLVVAWTNGMKEATEKILKGHAVDWTELSIFSRKESRAPEVTSEASTKTIMIIATKRTAEDWRGVCREIRNCCRSYGLDTNVEIADGRGLKPVESFGVAASERIYEAWPLLKKEVIRILGLRLWLALELLRRGKGDTAEENPITIVITIDRSPQPDWTEVRERIVDLLESNHFEDVAVEIGRGSICRTAQKDSRLLWTDAYQMKAQMGTSIGPIGNVKSAGTFGCYVRIRSSADDEWQTFGLTCHHVVLPPSIKHPLEDHWNEHGIIPNEKANNLQMDMPSLLDHLGTIQALKESVQDVETEDHKTIGTRFQDPEDFVPPYQRIGFERVQRFKDAITSRIRTAEELFENGSERLGSVYASSGLRLASSSSASVDWALIKIKSPRSSYNYFPSTDDAPDSVNLKFFPTPNTMNETQKPLESGTRVFMKGRSTGFTMGNLQDKRITSLQSWNGDGKGGLKQNHSEDYSVIGIKHLHVPGLLLFGRAGDSGSAIMTARGKFVGMYFAGNDYTGTGYFTCAEDIFSDIKRVTLAEEVELLQDPPEAE